MPRHRRAPRPSLGLTELERRDTPAATPEHLVGGFYQALLGRPADADGLATHLDELARSGDPAAVTRGIVASPEFRVHAVGEIYATYLGRDADAAGLEHQAAFLAGGASLDDVLANVLGSDEYYQAYGRGTDDGFVTAVYRDLFGRASDDAGRAVHLAALGERSRAAVAADMLATPEAETAAARRAYFTYLSRPADAAGLADWVERLQGGVTAEGLAAGFLASAEFAEVRDRLGGSLDVPMTLDTGNAVAAAVGPDGGVLATTDARGNRYTLTVPVGALSEVLTLTMTPIAAADLPAAGGLMAGVSFGPEGTRLQRPATFTIDLPAGTDPGPLVGFGSEGGGRDLHLTPVTVDGSRLTYVVRHFSEKTAAGAGSADVAAQAARTPSAGEAVFEQTLAAVRRAGDVSSEALGGLLLSTAEREALVRSLREWFNVGIKPTMQSGVVKSIEQLQAEAVEYKRWTDAIKNDNYDLSADLTNELNAGSFLLELNIRDQINKAAELVERTGDERYIKQLFDALAADQMAGNRLVPVDGRQGAFDQGHFHKHIIDAVRAYGQKQLRPALTADPESTADVRRNIRRLVQWAALGQLSSSTEFVQNETEAAQHLANTGVRNFVGSLGDRLKAARTPAEVDAVLREYRDLLRLLTELEQFGADSSLTGIKFTPDDAARQIPIAVVVEQATISELGADGSARIRVRAGVSFGGGPTVFGRRIRLQLFGDHEVDRILGPDGEYEAVARVDSDDVRSLRVPGVVTFVELDAFQGFEGSFSFDSLFAKSFTLTAAGRLTVTPVGASTDGGFTFVPDPVLENNGQTAAVRFRVAEGTETRAGREVRFTLSGGGFFADGSTTATVRTDAFGNAEVSYRAPSSVPGRENPSGTATITATHTASGSSGSLRIRYGGLHLDPAGPLTLLVGNTRQFTAVSAAGQPVPGVTWELGFGPGSTPLGGRLSDAGLFEALRPGTYIVSAVVETERPFRTASAQVTVVGDVSINERSATVGQGFDVQFTARLTRPGIPVTWSVVTEGGAVDPTGGQFANPLSGLYRAPDKPGTYYVRAQLDDGTSDTVAVTVTEVIPIVVAPKAVTVVAGGDETFTATVNRRGGGAVRWSVVKADGTTADPDGGEINADGEYSAARKPGTYYVRAQLDANTFDLATVTVVNDLRVAAPDGGTAEAGDTTTTPFRATTLDGEPRSVTWSVVKADGETPDPDGGTIDADGFYTAPGTSRTVTIRAVSKANPNLRATATIEVTTGTVRVKPIGTLLPGFSVFLEAVNAGSRPVAVTWTVDGRTTTAADGRLLYVAPAEVGDYTVTAVRQDNGATASYTVQVRSLVITPDGPLTLRPGDERKFEATFNGEPVAVTWTIDGVRVNDTPSTTVTFVGDETGPHTVAAVDAVGRTAFVRVTVAPAAEVFITPDAATIAAGGQLRFEALDGAGYVVPVTWEVTSGAGSITPTGGLFIAAETPGLVAITATSIADPRISHTVTIEVMPPQSFNLDVHRGIFRLTVSVTDSNGQRRLSGGLAWLGDPVSGDPYTDDPVFYAHSGFQTGFRIASWGANPYEGGSVTVESIAGHPVLNQLVRSVYTLTASPGQGAVLGRIFDPVSGEILMEGFLTF